jgi:hypothetical protein
MSCECDTCCVYWIKINEIRLSFGEVLWSESVIWHIMRRGGSCFYSTLDMWYWPVCFIKMSFVDAGVTLRFANSLSQHNSISAIWCVFSSIWKGVIIFVVRRFVLLFSQHVSTQTYYMWTKCCDVVPFSSYSLKNVRSWVYLLYLGGCQRSWHRINIVTMPIDICNVFCRGTQDVFYVGVFAVILKINIGNV